MTSDSRLSFEVSSILSKNEGLSFVSMAVEEETETRSDLRRFAKSLKKGFVSDKGFARIFYSIIDQKKSKAGFSGFWVGNLFAPFAPWRERVFCREGRPRKSAFTYAKSERLIGAGDRISKFVSCLKSRLWRDAPRRRSLLLERSARRFAPLAAWREICGRFHAPQLQGHAR